MRVHKALLVAGLLFLVVASALLLRLREQSSMRWSTLAVSTGEDSGTTYERLFKALRWIADKDPSVVRGEFSHLLDLRSADGTHRVEVYVAEGKFTSEAVDPLEVWQQLVPKDALLVNSVDHLRRKGDRSSISYWIGDGCGVPPLEEPTQLGEVTFTDCNGAYSAALPVARVANAAIVIWADIGGAARCRKVEEGYEECIDQALDKALRRTFSHIRAGEAPVPSTMILPALGTGIGGLSKRVSYFAVRDALLEELQQPANSRALPDRIILQVFRGDTQTEREHTRYAISEAFSELHEDWSSRGHTPAGVDETANLAGVTLALAVIILLTAFSVPLPARLRSATVLMRRYPVLLTLGWAVAALGAVRLMRSVVFAFVQAPGFWWEFLYGAAAVAASIPLLLGSKIFREVTATAPQSRAAGARGPT